MIEDVDKKISVGKLLTTEREALILLEAEGIEVKVTEKVVEEVLR